MSDPDGKVIVSHTKAKEVAGELKAVLGKEAKVGVGVKVNVCRVA